MNYIVMWFKRIKSDQWCSITTKILKSLPLDKNQLYLLKRLLYNHNYGHTASWLDWTSNVRGFGEHLPLTWKGCTETCGPQDPLFTPFLLFTRPTVEVQSIHKTLIGKNVIFCHQNQTFSENMVIFSSRSSKLATK